MRDFKNEGKTISSDRPMWLYHAGMLASSFLVATSFPVAKAITPMMNSGVLTAVRFLLASLLFAPYIHKKFGIKNPGFKGLCRYALLSSTLVGFFWLTFVALLYTEPLNTGSIFTITPGLAGVCSWLLLREKIGMSRVLALIFALIGALWIVFQGNFSQILVMEFNKGDIIFLGACLCMALYAPLIKLLHRGEPMPVMTFWTMVTGTFWLFLFNGITMMDYPWTEVPNAAWIGIIYLAIFTTIVTFFLTQWSTMGLGPTRVSAYSYLYPVLVILLDIGLFWRFPTARTMIGVLIILPAMVLIQRGINKKADRF